MIHTMLARLLERAAGRPQIHCYIMLGLMFWTNMTILSWSPIMRIDLHDQLAVLVFGMLMLVFYSVREASDPRDKAIRGALGLGLGAAGIVCAARAYFGIVLDGAEQVGQLNLIGATCVTALSLWVLIVWSRHDWRAIRALTNWRTAPRPPLRMVGR